ncbi:unnamed protein product [Spirodela intermedia]|uniref:Uncharacterized protein n=1 Tax=Spirodela intermedia TaxID=51605 RepID=A0A7I8IXA5_SPIIN|nr:unnamed protein product [Spirodela intermedia]CAA6661801.1 unnamed protein product [Spirodela intermedia]
MDDGGPRGRFLVVNGVLRPAAPPPIAAFLESVSGAYTTTRTHEEGSVVLFWERHLLRLADSVRILADSSGSSFSRFIAFAARGGAGHHGDSFRMGGEEEALRGIEVSVHLGLYVPPVFGKGVRLALAGRGRDMAEAKSTEWVRTRKYMEKLRAPVTTELLLSNDGDRILEGSVTNFFVVCRRKVDSAESSKSGDHSEGQYSVEVQTAPLSDGILPGIIRQLVIEICSKRGIYFREVAPSWADRELWDEAFITNSLRLLQHVETIQVPRSWEDLDSKSWEEVSWEEQRFEGPGIITTQIQVCIWRLSAGFYVSRV